MPRDYSITVRWTKGSDVADADDSSVVVTAAAGPAGFVSGGAYNSKPAVWTSADGRVWKTIMLPYPAGDRNAQVSEMAVSGSLTPISLFTVMTETRQVSGRIAASSASMLMSPFG